MIEIRKQCPDCGENLTEQRWERTSDNKKFHAWRHEVKSDCKYIEWLNDKSKAPKSYKKSQNIAPKSSEEYQNLLAAMRELYILVKAAALQTTTERDLNDMIMKLKEGK